MPFEQQSGLELLKVHQALCFGQTDSFLVTRIRCKDSLLQPMWYQVFPMSAYQELFDGLQKTTAAGGPTYHLANYTVLTNSHQAIFGGWHVSAADGMACC